LKEFEKLQDKFEQLQIENNKLWEQIGNKIKEHKEQACNTEPF
jgi:predicted transcriptional regulator